MTALSIALIVLAVGGILAVPNHMTEWLVLVAGLAAVAAFVVFGLPWVVAELLVPA